MRNAVQTDMKRIVTFFNSANAPKKADFFPQCITFGFFPCEPEVPVVLNRFTANVKVMSESRPTANVRQIYRYQHLLLDKSTSLVCVTLVTITINAAQ